MTETHHADRDHAVLSASGSHRWLNCTPSATIEAELPDTTTTAAEEGTAAHELAEHKLKKKLKLLKPRTRKPKSEYDSAEMDQHTDDYVTYVLEAYKEAKKLSTDAEIILEHKVNFSHLVPDGFGTADCIIIADGTLTLIDLKYGKGVLVDAWENPQLKIYALGALNDLGMLYDVERVKMVIFQPRRENISVFEQTVEQLNTWAQETLVPQAQLAVNGDGEFKAGEWCTFCKIRTTCRARAENALKLAKLEFKDPPELTDEEIADALKIIPDLKRYAEALLNYATEKAMQGHNWPGFKVVEGRSIRKYTDEQAVISACEEAGFTDIFQKKLLTITAMQKKLGKKQFEELLGDLVHKPAGKPALVEASDPRPPLHIPTAAEEFAEFLN